MRFFLQTAAALILGVILIAICYFFVDRPVAWFVHDHLSFFGRWVGLGPLASEVLKYFVAAAIVGVVLWRLWKPAGRLQTVLLVVAANVIVTYVLKNFFKWACGRYWPMTWQGSKPSLIATGAYGFNPFHVGPAYTAFPSGHAALVFSIVSILWLCYPRLAVGDGCLPRGVLRRVAWDELPLRRRCDCGGPARLDHRRVDDAMVPAEFEDRLAKRNRDCRFPRRKHVVIEHKSYALEREFHLVSFP